MYIHHACINQQQNKSQGVSTQQFYAEKAHCSTPSKLDVDFGRWECCPGTWRFIWRLARRDLLERLCLSRSLIMWSTLSECQGRGRTISTSSPLSDPLSSLEITSSIITFSHFSLSFASANFIILSDAERYSSFCNKKCNITDSHTYRCKMKVTRQSHKWAADFEPATLWFLYECSTTKLSRQLSWHDIRGKAKEKAMQVYVSNTNVCEQYNSPGPKYSVCNKIANFPPHWWVVTFSWYMYIHSLVQQWNHYLLYYAA